MTITAILVVLFAHYFADFLTQPEWMASHKWHSLKALSSHVAVYTIGLFSVVWLYAYTFADANTIVLLAVWAAVNGLFHFFIDYATSRDMHRLWQDKEYRLFFIYIGLDQFLHYTVLVMTYSILTVLTR